MNGTALVKLEPVRRARAWRMPPPARRARRQPDLTGRIDVFVYQALERLIRRDPLADLLWDRGLGVIVENAVAESLPSRPLWRRRRLPCT